MNIIGKDDNPVVITAHSSLAPTGSNLEEIFANQLEGKPNNRKVGPLDFSSFSGLKDLLISDKDHPFLKTGMAKEEAIVAVQKVLELGGGFPSQINGAVSHNGEALDDKGLIALIKNALGEANFDEDYSTTLTREINKGKFDPSILHSIYMSLTALTDANLLNNRGIIDKNTGIHLGHGYAGLRNMERDGLGGLFFGKRGAMGLKHLPGTLTNMPAPIVANVLSMNGGATGDYEACAAAGYAYDRAMKELLAGNSKMALAGGTDAMHDSAYALSAFGRMGALARGYSDLPNQASRPFSKPMEGLERVTKGFVLGDGGGISVLELKKDAETRGMSSMADIIGIGTSTCTPMHIKGAGLTSGTVEGQKISMEKALVNAGVAADEFVEEGGVVFAHGTATEKGDIAEANSIYETFGGEVQITAPKSVLGHALGGSAAQSVGIAISSFTNDIIPGTHNYNESNKMDGIPDLNILSENKKGVGKYILINAFGFGGHNVSIVLRNPEK